jgi:mono/diheme cytochrome c family protein
MSFDRLRGLSCGLLLAALCPLTTGCRQKMADQPRYGPLEPSRFFADGQSSREPVPGTLARGEAWEDAHLLTGKLPGVPPTGSPERPAPSLDRAAEYVDTFPFKVTPDVVRRGRERFNIFCAACHDKVGTGTGPVVGSGYPAAQSFHTDRLRQAPAGYVFDVISNGYRAMPRFAGQIPPRDRWAVIAYARALQLSQHADLKTLPPDVRQGFEERP